MSNVEKELVFIPVPSIGHLRSTIELAKLILQRDECLSTTFLMINLPNRSKINAYVNSISCDNPYPTRLKFFTLPPLANPPNLSAPDFPSVIFELYRPIVKQAVEDRAQREFRNPIGLVLDMFCSSMVDVANELNIPSYIFLTSGSNLLNLMFLALSLADEQGVDVATMFSHENLTLSVPGFNNRVPTNVIPAIFQNKEGLHNMVLKFARKFKLTKGILVNTFEEFESFSIRALLDDKDDKIPHVYPVGPILEQDDKSHAYGSHNMAEIDSVMSWLDSQPKLSVVYICFGSMGLYDEEQIKEIAKGLEMSGYRFLWALRKPPQQRGSSDHGVFVEALPEDFLARTAHRGKVIGWASQIKVLAHPAIGGFVSHCGWNSTLESLWFGVPIATWPLYAEQQLNAFELVKELGLATEISIDYKNDWKSKLKGNFLLKAEEIEKGIDKLMKIDEEMRGKVNEMKEKGREALKEGSSSYNWLGRFIEDVFCNVT